MTNHRWASLIRSPYFIALILVLIITNWTSQYLILADDPNQKLSFLFEGLEVIHNKSIDFRLKFRGPRSGSPDVAILTIDEEAIQKYGRWPWPRKQMAKLIDKTMTAGAKTIGFDMIFSEEQKESLSVLSEAQSKIKNQINPSQQIDSIFEELISKNDNDQILANTIESFSEKLILGSFFNDDYGFSIEEANEYASYCFSTFSQISGDFQYWDKDKPIGSLDPYLNDFPTLWKSLLMDFLVGKMKIHFSSLNPKALENLKLSLPKNWNLSEKEYDRILLALIFKNREWAEELLYEKDIETPENLWPELTAALPHDIRSLFIKEGNFVSKEYCALKFLTEEDPLQPDLVAAWPEVEKDNSDIKMDAVSGQESIDFIRFGSLNNPVLKVNQWTLNNTKIQAVTENTGFFNTTLDKDGTIRRHRLFSRILDQYFPSLALQTFLVANDYNIELKIDKSSVSDSDTIGSKVVTSATIKDSEDQEIFKLPVSKDGTQPINYAGPEKMFAHISAGQILDDSDEITYSQRVYDQGQWVIKKFKEDKAKFLKNKNLVFGATAIGIYDLRVTPFEENFPGVETHANFLDNLIRRDFLVKNSDTITMAVILFLLSLVFASAICWGGSAFGFILTLVTLTSVLATDYFFFFKRGLVVNISLPFLSLLFLYIFLTFYKYFTEERQRRELKGTFQKYVSPAIVDEILKDPTKLELGGVKREMTVFFSDIRGFTTISERLDPQALSDLLNAYLTPMTDLVFQCNGTLDKYMGDAIMAFFGAPIPTKNHAEDACRSALLQIEKLFELQKEWKTQGLPNIDVGIGINTGEMSAGNMGSQTVRSYTVMGDAVNLGARLEGINKQYGTRIIISEFTQAQIQDKNFVTREIDWVRVKGKKEPVRIFELIQEGQANGDLADRLSHFANGFRSYHDKDFAQAQKHFNNSLQFMADDKVSELYIDRCSKYLKTPPETDWDGVFVMTTK